MARYWYSMRWMLSFCVFHCLLSLSGARETPSFKYKAVNLGGWLVTEGWIKPSLFDGIPNKDLLDGTQIQLMSVTQRKYLCAENDSGTVSVANRTNHSGWERFSLWRITDSSFSMRVFNRQFIGLDKQGEGINLVAVTSTPGPSETFEIVRNDDDKNRVRIKAPNGQFIQVRTEHLVTADFSANSSWGDDDPSVFVMGITRTLRGEFQITNGYGREKATQILQEHWKTFIVEEDFKFVSENGLTAVRIPVGWWIASDPTPPWPFIGGSLQALDNAFSWARKYNVKIIIDLHAAPGSQNGLEHSGARDGFLDWGQTDENIQQTVDVIEFLTARYAKNPSLVGVELINEPLSPGVSLETINKYYKAGYDAVRKHSSTAYVIMANRVGQADSKELLPLASGRAGTVIDLHFYNLFLDVFDNMTVQDNIDFVQTNRSTELNMVTTSNGPLTFVGEWVAEWQVRGATKEDYQSFSKAQLEVYGRATFGYAKNPSLVGVQLINEPLSPGVSLETLNKYYKAGYDVVRKHSSMAYVIMANRLGPADSKEFLPLASGRTGTVIDMHFYNLFSDIFDNMTVQENIDFVQTNKSSQQNVVTTSNGPLTFVGKWVTEWQVRGATKEDYQRFAKVQLEVYGQATFGWAYWTLKNVNNHWSLEWMTKNNYMTL